MCAGVNKQVCEERQTKTMTFTFISSRFAYETKGATHATVSEKAGLPVQGLLR